jgi:hypothetical protein
VLNTFRMLVGLILIAPAIAFVDGAIPQGLVAGALAVALAAVARTMRPGEFGHFEKLVRPLALIAAIPALWMLFQVIPLPLSWAHPIWASAQTALNEPISGRLTIDSAQTLMGLGHYLCALAMAFVAAAVTIDRERAELLLSVLAGVTTVMAILLFAVHFNGSRVFGAAIGSAPRAAMTAASAFGTIIGAGSAIRTFERYETRRSSADIPFAKFLSSFAASIVAMAICGLAVITAAPVPVIFAAACGFALLTLIVVVRRLALGPLVSVTFGVTAVVAAVAIAESWSGGSSSNWTLHFAGPLPPALASAIQRMLIDTGVTGIGAGNFAALLPLYGGDEDQILLQGAPTTAAAIAIELGRPALWSLLALASMIIVPLLHGALRRGRDSFYAAAAASCAVVAMLEVFTDASLIQASLGIIAPAILGLGLAQSVRRPAQ